MTISAITLTCKSLGAIRRQIQRDPALLEVRDPEFHGATILHHIAWSGDLKAVKLLVKLGADVDIKDHVGETPIHGAAGWGNVDVVRYLITQGADVNSTSDDGSTALDYASDLDQTETVEVLLAAGAISPRDSNKVNEER